MTDKDHTTALFREYAVPPVVFFERSGVTILVEESSMAGKLFPGGKQSGPRRGEEGASAKEIPVIRRGVAPLVGSIAFLTGVLLLVLFGYFGWLSYRNSWDHAQRQARELAGLVEHQTAQMLDASALLLKQLHDVATTVDWEDPASFRRSVAEIYSMARALPFVESVWVTDDSGWVRITSVEAIPEGFNVSEEEYFQLAKTTIGRTHISNLLVREITGRATFNLVRAIQSPAGGFDGVVFVSFDPTHFASPFHRLQYGFDATFDLFKLDGSLLALWPHFGQEHLMTATIDEETRQRVLVAPIGETSYVDRNGQRRYGFYRRVGDYPVFIRIGLDPRQVLQHWWASTWPQAAVVVIALALVLGLYLVTYRRAITEDRLAVELERRVELRTTDLQKSLREKELLFRELHHRVKNNLQVVMSLLSLQASKSDAQQQHYFQESRRRLIAMSKMHEQLYLRGSAGELNLAPYLPQLAAEIARAYGAEDRVNIRVDAEDLRVVVDQATPLVLVTGEVLSNCFKHGFLDGRAGSVDILLRRENGRARLVIRDDGSGFASDNSGQTLRNLGMILIENLSKQAQGTPKIESGPDGTTFTLEFDVIQA